MILKIIYMCGSGLFEERSQIESRASNNRLPPVGYFSFYLFFFLVSEIPMELRAIFEPVIHLFSLKLLPAGMNG